MIQFMPCCARHDASLTYTLKPGLFSFSNIEFETQYHVNHMGLRDDEESLNNPQIIVLGDSQAMGWGVEQKREFCRVSRKGERSSCFKYRDFVLRYRKGSLDASTD